MTRHISKKWVELISYGLTKDAAMKEICEEENMGSQAVKSILEKDLVWRVNDEGFRYFEKHNASKSQVRQYWRRHAIIAFILIVFATYITLSIMYGSPTPDNTDEEEMSFEESRRIDRAITCHKLDGRFDYDDESCEI